MVIRKYIAERGVWQVEFEGAKTVILSAPLAQSWTPRFEILELECRCFVSPTSELRQFASAMLRGLAWIALLETFEFHAGVCCCFADVVGAKGGPVAQRARSRS